MAQRCAALTVRSRRIRLVARLEIHGWGTRSYRSTTIDRPARSRGIDNGDPVMSAANRLTVAGALRIAVDLGVRAAKQDVQCFAARRRPWAAGWDAGRSQTQRSRRVGPDCGGDGGRYGQRLCICRRLPLVHPKWAKAVRLKLEPSALSLPEIKDVNAIGDTECYRPKTKRFGRGCGPRIWPVPFRPKRPCG